MPVNVKSKLGVNAFKVDSASHITLNHQVCRTQCKSRFCAWVCPAHLYTLEADGLIHAEYDGCLECGTCVIACSHGALSWHYPHAGYGVQYRFG